LVRFVFQEPRARRQRNAERLAKKLRDPQQHQAATAVRCGFAHTHRRSRPCTVSGPTRPRIGPLRDAANRGKRVTVI
jgi:hypothetical protein